jgi:hypothetical protein|tara:strand:- start:999 stop:1211 length:213 start_codon:yes stop_codon:yes gene_type:complete
MKEETIKYTIKQDGTVTEEVLGVSGKSCVDITEDIEIKLGDLKQQIYTADYYDADFNQDITINTNTDVTF